MSAAVEVAGSAGSVARSAVAATAAVGLPAGVSVGAGVEHATIKTAPTTKTSAFESSFPIVYSPQLLVYLFKNQ
jgi:hypothetical protein